MIATMRPPTFNKTPRQMLASMATDVQRQIRDWQSDPRTVAEAARQYAVMILAECDRVERGSAGVDADSSRPA